MSSREESLCVNLKKELEKENDERNDGQTDLQKSLSQKLVFQQKVPSHVFEALALQDRANPPRTAAAPCSNLEEEPEEEANVKGNISLLLKTRPNLATGADGKETKGSTKSKKKWATVQIGLGPEHADLSVLLNGDLATPADLGSPLQWREELTRVSCMNSIVGAKRGVVGAELTSDDTPSRNIVILKAGNNGAQEVFSGLIGEKLGIRCPRIRVVEHSSERQAIEQPIFDLLVNDVYWQTNTLGYLQQSKQLLLMEAGTHRVTLDKLAESNHQTISIDMAFELGVLIPFDMILANGDRLPLKNVWDRPGNAHNFLFPIYDGNGKDYHDSPLLAIDQVCTHPRNETLLEEYLAAIADTLSSTERLESALEVTIAFLGRASHTELRPGTEEALLAGVKEGVQRVAKLDRNDLVVVVNQVREMGSTDAWREDLHDNINLDIMCDIMDICKTCPLNEMQ